MGKTRCDVVIDEMTLLCQACPSIKTSCTRRKFLSALPRSCQRCVRLAAKFVRNAETQNRTQAQANKVSKNEQDLQEFANALEEHRAKGTEEQEMTRKVQKSKRKAAASKAKAKREFEQES